MAENLLCYGDKPMPFAFPGSKLGTANLKLSFVPRCLPTPPGRREIHMASPE